MTSTTSNHDLVQLTWKEMGEKSGNFNEKFSQALKDGFFYVEIPVELKANIEKTKEFGNGLRANEFIKQLKLHDRLDYQERQGTQDAAFGAMNKHWETVFPDPVKDLAIAMNATALDILKAALKHLSVPENLWSQATGELTDDKGANVFSFNNYKPGEQKIGLTPHKDLGWITLLFIDKMGLETSLDGKKWIPIPPKEGYFVVNFGQAFEILINSTDKLRASLHRVRRLEEERVTFGIFNFQKEGAEIFQMKESGNLEHFATYGEYLNLCYAEFARAQKEIKED